MKRSTRLVSHVALAFLLLLLVVGVALALPGGLDPRFGTGGKVTTPIGATADAYALVLQPDGKLVAAGFSSNGSQTAFALARYRRDGTLDTSFGTGGKVTTPIGTSDDDAYALVLQPDGKLVAAGLGSNGSNYDFALARYLGSR